MNPKIKTLGGALIIAAAALGPSLAGSGTIKIAALYNVTGGMSSLDGPSLKGAKLAVSQINAAGGVLGQQIELIAIDTRTDMQETSIAAQRALSQGVVAGIGQSDTTFVMAAAPLLSGRTARRS